MKKAIALMTALSAMSGLTQAQTIALNPFTQAAAYSFVTTSGASSSGFTDTYTGTAASHYNYANLTGGQLLINVGDTAKFTFDISTTQISASDRNFDFGFDFGVGLFRSSIDLGTPVTSLAVNGYNDTYPMGTIPGAQAIFNYSTSPGTASFITAANTSGAGTTIPLSLSLTRTDTSAWTMDLAWGTQDYIYSITNYVPGDISGSGTADYALDSVYVGTTSTTLVSGDNYTISSAQLTITSVPEPATMALFGGGLALMLALRRSRQ